MTHFEIRQIDAYIYDNEWIHNTTYLIGDMITRARDKKRAFIRYLKRKGITFYRGRTIIEFDGDCYTVCDRKTKEPLFIAIPLCW